MLSIVGHSGALISASFYTAQAVSGAAAKGDQGPIIGSIAGVLVSLGIASGTVMVLTPTILRIQKGVLESEIDDVMRAVELEERRREKAPAPAGDVLKEVISFRHREALGATVSLFLARARGAAGFLLLFLVSPVASVVTGMAVVVYGYWFSQFLDEILGSLDGEGPIESRKGRYARELQFDVGIAGELGVFNARPWLAEQFRSLSTLGRAKAAKLRTTSLRPALLSALGAILCFVLTLAYLGRQTWTGSISVGSLAIALQGVLLLLNLGPVGDTAVICQRAASTDAKVQSTLDSAKAPNSSRSNVAAHLYIGTNTARNHAEIGSVIDVSGLEFRYPGAQGPAVLIDHLQLMQNESVAIVGANGAGKSTFLAILAGYLNPTLGTVVRHDGGQTSIALQRAVRYPTSLFENVSLGRNEVDLALALALTGTSIDLGKMGSSSPLRTGGASGVDLSGGQWQRVGLARAMAIQSDLLLLDEPSAALDPVAELEFFRAALSSRANRTTIVTTHQMANAKLVDRILVMDRGEIVEDGTHHELLALGGTYARMYRAQAASLGIF